MFRINTIFFRQYFTLILALAMLPLSGCGPSAGGGTEATGVQGYDWSGFTTYVKSEFSKSTLPSYTYISNTGEIPFWMGEVTTDNPLSGNTDYTDTNVQEPGVDEGDRVKTDGTYLYIADNSKVHIAAAVPADAMTVLSTIDVDGTVESLYLKDNTLIILYIITDGEELDWASEYPCLKTGITYCSRVNVQLGVKIMDVTNPSSPEWLWEWALDGSMISSRLIDGKLHIVQRFLPDLPPLQIAYDGTEEGRDEAVAANEAALEDITVSELIPYYNRLDENGNITESGPLITPDNFYYPDESSGGSILSLVTFDLNNPSGSFISTGLIADAHTVYSSADTLYIASTKYSFIPADHDQAAEYYRTFIYRFPLNGSAPCVEGTGTVRGKILNQFSMGEYDNVLRIATTSLSYTPGESGGTVKENNIYCLEEEQGDLEITGSIEGIAPGENIYSARFIGTRGFLVTFVKVDPLFTIDLSDPTNPTVAGELHVPGYSEYIHPMGDDYLITIGKATVDDTDSSWIFYQGLQLSIFDVSSFSSPQLLHTQIIGDRGTESFALHDHKAFTYMSENGLLAIPVTLYEYPDDAAVPQSNTQGNFTFEGLYIYRAAPETGFEYLGRISTNNTGYQSYSTDWLRGIFIDEDVYAVNEEIIKSSKVDDIEGTVNTLSLSGSD